jgi:hypothetical protein
MSKKAKKTGTIQNDKLKSVNEDAPHESDDVEIIRDGFVKIPPSMTFKAKGTVKSAKFGTIKVREPNTEHSDFVKIPPTMKFKAKGTVKSAKFGTIKLREPNTEHSGFITNSNSFDDKSKSKKENDSEIE